MLCYKFRDTRACDAKDCKYLHVAKDEFDKLSAFMMVGKSNKKDDKGGTGDASPKKKAKANKKKKGGGDKGAAAEQSAE